MTEQERIVDTMLANAAARMLRAGETTQQMRSMQREGADERYWRTAQQLAHDLGIAGHCLTEAYTILLHRAGIANPAQLTGGGMIQ
jgi:hypothetical protein